MTTDTDTTHTDTTHTATTTTGSGSPGSPHGRSAERLSVAEDYSSVPFFRKRWSITVLFLIFIPAMIVICLTGPVYQNDNGRALEWEDKQRYTAAIGGALFMAIGLLRLFATPAS